MRAEPARGSIALAALCLCLFTPAASAAAATVAGTGIVNTAKLGWNDDAAHSTSSNTVSLITAELLNVTLAAERATIAVKPGDVVAASFLVTNTGNGAEDFALTIVTDQPGVPVTSVAIDTDSDGAYDPAKDQSLPTDAPLPLTPGKTVRVFVLVDGDHVVSATRITASVISRTGSGLRGTTFAGAGDDGGDAVVGTTGAAATAATLLTLPAGLPGLVKSQSVFAPDGSARAVRGSIVTYRLVASFPAATHGAVIDDPIPAGTDYLPGSLMIDDRTVTDARDADAGSFDASAIHAALGDVAAAGIRTIQFSVKIQ